MQKNCLFCDKAFIKSPTVSLSYWDNSAKFCSRVCSNNYRRGKPTNYGHKISLGLKKAYAENRGPGFSKGHKPWCAGTRGVVKAWNKGMKIQTNTGRTHFKKGVSVNPFPKGNVPWNKGKNWPEMRGANHPNWKGGKPKTNRRETMDYETYRKYLDWQKAVFARDNWECQFCGKHGGVLHADHIKSWAKHPELRFDIDNGRTLCPPCHTTTESYGRTLKTNKLPIPTQ